MQKKQRKHGIIWFRNNLRVKDHLALKEAVNTCRHVTGIYILETAQFEDTPWGFPKTGGHRLRFLLETLEALKKELATLNIPLHFQTGASAAILPGLVKRWQAEALFTQKEWTAEETAVDTAIANRIDIPLYTVYDQFLIHPEDLPLDPLKLPEVFTTFRKAVESGLTVRPVITVEALPDIWTDLPGINTELPDITTLGVSPEIPDSRTAFPFKGGTMHALERIDHYFWKTKKLQYYKRTRNGLTGTDYSSKFSPWLANGSISARMIYHQVKAFESEVISNRDTYWLVFELLWRDYFKYLSIKHGDRIFQKGGIRMIDIRWPFDRETFRQWTTGKTGNDFVDANMIELARTGWMSNRGRQNVASFWAKDLGQDWRAGAAWFESQLLDYDVHSNWGNWNYVSGVGNDPRDRKFNTQTQAERYDASGTFRNLWLQNTLF